MNEIKAEFEDLNSYLDAYEKNPDLGIVPVPLVAHYLGRTAAAVTAMIRSKRLAEVKIGRNRYVSLQSLLEDRAARENEMERVKGYLVKQAKRGVRAVFYDPVMAQVGLSSGVPTHRSRIGNILGDISEDSYDHHGILLSVLVHRKTAGRTRPGAGFFELAEAFGLKWDDDDVFVEKQTDLVLRFYAKRR